MKIYKARLVRDVVAQGLDAEDALKAIHENFGDDDGMEIERFTQVKGLDDLPRGWNGSELAYAACLDSEEQPIAFWLGYSA
jgi:hypothetical protein